MSDAQHRDVLAAREAGADVNHEAKIEQLLLAGLDHYFAGQYDQAINVWSRAFFFERDHPRARAYIERARSALAERQRESEELLQNGVAAFHRGDAGEARRLLNAAIDRGAPSEEALAVLGRLDRLERGGRLAGPLRFDPDAAVIL
jgi:tetratricopeptide (TPR) repeat protein